LITNINDENPKYNGVEIEVDRIFEPIVGLRKVIIEFIRDATKNLPNAGNCLHQLHNKT
jgi:hypothetical protein